LISCSTLFVGALFFEVVAFFAFEGTFFAAGLGVVFFATGAFFSQP